MTATYAQGKWHGKKYYLGMHYDLHATVDDTELGANCSPDELGPMLKIMKPDFVQTDCKGHPGVTSWYSQVPDATVSPGIVKDAMAQWRETTKKLNMPLHCHYSGIWDKAAAKKHPEWTVMAADGSQKSEKMCPRGPYLEKLMIPQLLELIDRYGVDGFWIDGDIWAVEHCYCPKCRQAFTERTGIKEAPTSVDDPNWTEWVNFQRESFEDYVTRYVNAVHDHTPNVLVCSNWLQTFKNPGPTNVPTDWISGDNAWIWGLDGSRCEARWLSHRGKPWDIMLWSFSKTKEMGNQASPWDMKPVEMLQQEAAMLLAAGGNVQIYETCGLRNGQLVPWRMERLRKVTDFVRKRRAVCQDTSTFPSVAVLHSEAHYYSKSTASSIMYSYDISPVQGATWCLSDSHFLVDILDETRLKEEFEKYMVIVVPEQTRLSEEMVTLLKNYVEEGGLLLLTGAELAERFGYSYLGIKTMGLKANGVYHLPVGKNETFPLYSAPWGEITAARGARCFGKLGTTPLLKERITAFPATVSTYHGDGEVMFIPANVFHDYAVNRYPETRCFVKEAMKRLCPDPPFVIEGPTAVDVIGRVGTKGMVFHFINRASGLPTSPGQGMVDEIPLVGPVTMSVNLGFEPKAVEWLFEDSSNMTYIWTPLKCDCEDCNDEEEDEEQHDHHHDHDEDCDCGCCHEHVEEGQSGVLEVTIQHLHIHGALRIQ